MKISERWLREWIDPPDDAAGIARRLTLAGIEAEASELPGVDDAIRVARIRDAQPHPDADHLRVCQVDIGQGALKQIVCGAGNARAGLVTAVALPDARLPDGTVIQTAELRGVASQGMLCSAAELGLAEHADGLLELDPNAQLGTTLNEHLQLEDRLIELDLTPNRGDCLGVAGLARELVALYGVPLAGPLQKNPVVSAFQVQEVSVGDSAACPHYAGRIIMGLKANARTPDWMRERLRRSGLRPLHPLVDVTHYVMLELGQPMHAFDGTRLDGALQVRAATAGERLGLLNGTTIELAPGDLVIADRQGPVALAGVMGGQDSAVGPETTQVFLESACFDPVAVATGGRRHGILSDARHRFERGVDPGLQRRALDRATVLIQKICGGEPGPVTEVGRAPAFGATIRLRHERVERLLGFPVPAATIPQRLKSLGIETLAETAGTWRAHVPSNRYDLRIEADLVEEIGRLIGYENIPDRAYGADLAAVAVPETRRDANLLRDRLATLGYREIVSYSFVDPRLQAALSPESTAVPVDNPMAETMAEMRTTLWPGLIAAWRHNRQRQISTARLFEIGACFSLVDDKVVESRRLGGLVAGRLLPEQWSGERRVNDFFDVKGDLEILLDGARGPFAWQAEAHPALHPGRSARLRVHGRPCGWLGSLHPQIARDLDLDDDHWLFEIDLVRLLEREVPRAQPLSEQPSTRRDLALLVPDELPAATLLEQITDLGLDALIDVRLFDIYRSETLGARKSVALGLIFQDISRTLTDQQVDDLVARVLERVRESCHAELRS